MTVLTETEWGMMLDMLCQVVEACFDFLQSFTLVVFGGVGYSLLDLLVSISFLWLLVDFLHDLRSAGPRGETGGAPEGWKGEWRY